MELIEGLDPIFYSKEHVLDLNDELETPLQPIHVWVFTSGGYRPERRR